MSGCLGDQLQMSGQDSSLELKRQELWNGKEHPGITQDGINSFKEKLLWASKSLVFQPASGQFQIKFYL